MSSNSSVVSGLPVSGKWMNARSFAGFGTMAMSAGDRIGAIEVVIEERQAFSRTGVASSAISFTRSITRLMQIVVSVIEEK